MHRIMVLFALLGSFFFTATSGFAQSAPERVDINVDLSCGSLTVNLNSDYERRIIAQVYAGTKGPTNWNLVNEIGDFTVANPFGSGSKTYFFVLQPANTQISYSVRAYDDETNTLVDSVTRTADCDGDGNNTTTITTTTTTAAPVTTAPSTASFLASCDTAGGILVQPIGGSAFSLNATQISQGTAMAIASNQNTTIATASGITAFGTPSNSVLFIASDGYSLAIPAQSCVQVVSSPPVSYTTPGAQAADLSCSSTPAGAVNTHVVRSGENLFRIGLRYGVPFQRLASYNGIPDATRIFVGQCIAIPPA